MLEPNGTISDSDDVNDTRPPVGFVKELVSWIRFLASVIVTFLIFTTFAFVVFFIPSESMQPGLQVGDRFVVAKWVYGWSRESLPMGLGRILPSSEGRVFFRAPKHGDVVVFSNPKNNKVTIKRVIGLSGDTVETRGGRLYLNGEQVQRTFLGIVRYRDRFGVLRTAQSYSEKIGTDRKRSHKIFEFSDEFSSGNWSPDRAGPFLVKQGHVFVMGDNRDMSLDSRAPDGPGQVPMENLIGKAEMVLFTFARCKPKDGLDCPPSRLWRLM
ncbi:MAG: signal peptidase I [Robiginitomaculum sp.]|nr:signal peptidase I [Robiginitomaculum sp.]